MRILIEDRNSNPIDNGVLPVTHALSETVVDVIHGERRAVLTATAERPTLVWDVAGEMLATMPLGLEVDGADLGAGARIVTSTEREVREEWTAAFGKATGAQSGTHIETTVVLRTGEREWAVVIRVSSDGFAFRYRLPADARGLGAEHTRVIVAAESRAWVLDYQTWYETPRYGADLDGLASGDYGFPLLLEVSPGRFLLISEADINGRTSGAHAAYDGEHFRIVPADALIEVEGAHLTPWRVGIAGSLAEVVASTLVDELAPAAASEAFVARPGRAAWSWWSSQYSGAYLDVQKRFTDFAAEQGWEHVLVDCGWDAAWVPELVSYASVHGIQVHLWSSWSDLDGEESLRKLALWRSWGVAGIKVDFMESEAQERYRWYDAIIEESARVGLAVNFHGSVIPRGWARTHPHVVSYEGIRGAEYYVFYGTPLTAAHNVIQPFTRNVVGSMDYTPVTFSAPERETSDAHELALGIVYESGITHFADDPDQYRTRPLAARFLADLAPTWHEVRLLDGHPDTHATLARRHGDRWFVGCIGAEPGGATVSFDPSALVDGPAEVWIIRDGEGGLVEDRLQDAAGLIDVVLAPRGGFVAIVVPAGAEVHRASARTPLPAPTRADELLMLTGDRVIIDTDAESIRLPLGWEASRVSERTWSAAPTVPVAPGTLVVATLEKPGHDGVPVVSHVRIVAPLAGEPHDLSDAAFLSTSNAIGPVERGLANGGGDPRDGAALTVRGEVFADGLGVAQSSSVVFAIPGAPRHLTGSVAVDDETPAADAHAEIVLDGEVVARFALTGGSVPTPFEIDVDGITTLELRTSPGAAEETHVDWLTLRLAD
ncbi:MAG: glycoside hydrolase family 97 catalytic domain-containing protein [Candidatus Microbacterium colombiense]|nr:MAG: glycoside hydrolase family 97 catalytic domain-containing protein [Microbacterium sp.]